jgi:hypothetical protein
VCFIRGAYQLCACVKSGNICRSTACTETAFSRCDVGQEREREGCVSARLDLETNTKQFVPSGDVYVFQAYSRCVWFESQAGHWLSFLRCFMFFLSYVTPTLSYTYFILLSTDCVIFRHYLI